MRTEVTFSYIACSALLNLKTLAASFTLDLAIYFGHLMKTFFLSITTALQAQDIASFEKRITVKKLANGLTIILMERPEAPVFSFYTRVDAGSVQEVPGSTGLAHMFEHMAFKGTHEIGTTNWPAEKVALEKVETAYSAYLHEKLKEVGRDEKKLTELEKAWQDAVNAAEDFVIPNQFPEIIESEGGVGLNASTDRDETTYFYSLPENRLELWAYLESQRFLEPVMREFYKERDVVYEERRTSVDSSPQGRLLEQFLAAAYTAHPYGRPVVGWPSDLHAFSATDAINFFHKYYVPSNMIVALVGDLKPAETMPILEKYFGRIPARPDPEPLRIKEPPQESLRTVVIHDRSQPVYLEGYHRPDIHDPDDPVYDVLSDLLSKGRTSRLYRSLVRDKRIAIEAQGGSFPGSKYPSLFYFYAVPTQGHTADEMAGPIHDEIEKLKTHDVTDDELQSIKTRAKADLIRDLGSNQGLATELVEYQALYGDWRELFRQIDEIDKVTKADIRRVANKTFNEQNRTVAKIVTETPKTEPASAAKGEQQ
jgi:predicted Zn-dependent peptidase